MALDHQTAAGNSGRHHRKSSAGLACVGCAISVYLSIYQYGGLIQVWEPFFGNGSKVVLHSGLLDPVSRALGFPVHDAALGAVGYCLEALLALAGYRSRATSGTWFDAAYCGLVVAMGLTSLILVLLQAIVFGAFCTLCLTSAAISEAIVLLSWQELSAEAAHLTRLWKVKQT